VIKKFLSIMGPEDLLRWTEEPAKAFYNEPEESNRHPHTYTPTFTRWFSPIFRYELHNPCISLSLSRSFQLVIRANYEAPNHGNFSSLLILPPAGVKTSSSKLSPPTLSPHWEEHRVCLRKGCWEKNVDIRGRKWWETGRDCKTRSFITCTLYEILLGKSNQGG